MGANSLTHDLPRALLFSLMVVGGVKTLNTLRTVRTARKARELYAKQQAEYGATAKRRQEHRAEEELSDQVDAQIGAQTARARRERNARAEEQHFEQLGYHKRTERPASKWRVPLFPR